VVTYPRVPRKSDHWDFIEKHDRIVSRAQLREFGWSDDQVDREIGHWLRQVHQGVFLAGGGQLSNRSRWRAAVVATQPNGLLSHASAAVVWDYEPRDFETHVSVPRHTRVRHPGIRIHRPAVLPRPRYVNGLAVSSPLDTLVDLAASKRTDRQLERLLDDAARRRLIDLASARDEVKAISRRGARRLAAILDDADATDSDLEDVFLGLIRGAGLPEPLSQKKLCGYRVDFFWPTMRLVVETDGLAFHRTRDQQAKDRARDQRLTAAGYTCLRFTNHQVRHQQKIVLRTLRVVMRRAA
jgi:hypothetical protein